MRTLYFALVALLMIAGNAQAKVAATENLDSSSETNYNDRMNDRYEKCIEHGGVDCAKQFFSSNQKYSPAEKVALDGCADRLSGILQSRAAAGRPISPNILGAMSRYMTICMNKVGSNKDETKNAEILRKDLLAQFGSASKADQAQIRQLMTSLEQVSPSARQTAENIGGGANH